MSILRRLLPERRAISYQSVWGSGGDWASSFGNTTGVTITQDNAWQVVTVFACVRLLSDLVSTLPVDTFIRVNDQRLPFRPRPAWIDQPQADDPNVTRIQYISQLVVSLMFDGNAFVFTNRDREGQVIEVIAQDPSTVEVKRVSGRKRFLVRNDSGQAELTDVQMLHIPLILKAGAVRGISPIEELRNAIALTSAAQQMGERQFGQGISLPGVVEVPGDLTDDQRKEMRDNFRKHHGGTKNAGVPGVLTGGATWKNIGVSNEQAQFLQTRQFQRADIAGIFRVPPYLVGDTSDGAMARASIEAQTLGLQVFTIRPLVELLEAGHNRLIPSRAFLKFNLNAMVRADIATRLAAYSTGMQAGIYVANDPRRLEDLPPLEGGDTPLRPLELGSVTDVDRKSKVEQATALITVGFAPDAALAAVGLPPITHLGAPVPGVTP